MSNEELAKLVADGLIESGVEGGFDNVCCSTAYDSLCLGCSSWEQERGQDLLSRIDGAERFMDRTYSDLSIEEMEILANMLSSEEGELAQRELLAEDCAWYVEAVQEEGLTDTQAIVYAAMWCPTSVSCVQRCINRANEADVDINNVEELAEFFYDNYPRIAGCEEYAKGYQNRSENQLDYCLSMEA